MHARSACPEWVLGISMAAGPGFVQLRARGAHFGAALRSTFAAGSGAPLGDPSIEFSRTCLLGPTPESLPSCLRLAQLHVCLGHTSVPSVSTECRLDFSPCGIVRPIAYYRRRQAGPIPTFEPASLRRDAQIYSVGGVCIVSPVPAQSGGTLLLSGSALSPCPFSFCSDHVHARNLPF